MKLEESVLTALTQDFNMKKLSHLGLRKELFIVPLNQQIFEFLKDYWVNGGMTLAANETVLKEEFPEFEFQEIEETVEWLVDTLKSRWKRNQTETAIMNVASLYEDDRIDDAVAKMTNLAWEITEFSSSGRQISDMTNIEAREARYEEKAAFDGSVKGVPLGFQAIDEHLYGMLPGTLTVCAAYTGVGKSWMGVMASLAASVDGWKTYIANFELGQEDLEDRLDTVFSGVPYQLLDRAQLHQEQMVKLREAREMLASLGGPILEKLPDNERTVQAIVTRARELGCTFIVIDQLSFIKGRKDNYKTPQDRYEEILDELHTEAQRSGQELAILALHQLNTESQSAKSIELTHLAEARWIARYSDIVFYLHQSKEMAANNAMEFGLIKVRKGTKKRWLLDWYLTQNVTQFSVNQEITDDFSS